MANNILEIFTDASIKTYENGRTFGCSGAYAVPSDKSVYYISPDTTNNRSELLGIYLGCKLADAITTERPNEFDKIILYSDSQFAIFGLTKWMEAWLQSRDSDGIIYSVSTRKPVKNQELFLCIIKYCIDHDLKICFRHCASHVKYYSPYKLSEANEVYNKSNGCYLRAEEIFKISYYNDIVDRESRSRLQEINPDIYPRMQYYTNIASMSKYDISGYRDYIN